MQTQEPVLHNHSQEMSLREQSRQDSDLPYRLASGKSLADYDGGWVGDDFEACLQLVRESRSKVNFSKYEPF